MAQATVARPTRTDKAAGIITRHEAIPLDDGTWHVRDTLTGSGQWHTATARSCDCYDARRGTCKHQIAVRRETAALEAYAARWDAASSQIAKMALTSAEFPQIAQRPSCPMCGAALETRQYYVGGRGWQFVEVCANDVTHSSQRA